MRRSMLFLPGNNPNMMANIEILGADAIILDLEDAVSPDEKDAARILVRNSLENLDLEKCEIIVRINSIDGNGYWKKDLDEVVPLRPHMIMPTKVGEPEDVLTVSAYIRSVESKCGLALGTVKLIPLIETAKGIENACQIAKADKRVTAILLGAEDLTANLHCVRTKEGTEIFYARSRIVSAARAVGIDAYDTPFTDINDDEGLLKDVKFAKSLGFTGKASISPRHIACINSVFSPTREEIHYAHNVIEAIERAKSQHKGAIALNGKMIDAPIVSRARQVLEIEKAIGGADNE